RVRLAKSAAQLVEASGLVIEAANKGVVQTAVRDALAAGKKAMLLTIGALADDALREDLLALARKSGGKIYLPSGAVMGVDGVKAAAEADLKSVTLVTTKPPQGLDKKTDRWTLLFSGPAREAVQRFPKNVNVAATLSLAGLGFDQTHVQVAIDPLATRNSHKVIIEGTFGRARIEVENLASPTNPATSYLASLSAIALLRRIVSPIEIGA
ncbi:MAG TPA: aspartate dehydrogenase, partial [Candidatus Thermoplasmatota archaeon]|nr:aspartate dehydrogenase [Candidatus Thermoplasmatota archaeon]